jgi:hypothetical protein
MGTCSLPSFWEALSDTLLLDQTPCSALRWAAILVIAARLSIRVRGEEMDVRIETVSAWILAIGCRSPNEYMGLPVHRATGCSELTAMRMDGIDRVQYRYSLRCATDTIQHDKPRPSPPDLPPPPAHAFLPPRHSVRRKSGGWRTSRHTLSERHWDAELLLL